MILLGFSSGLPILLVFSTLSVWLSKAGVERSTITLFSWAGFAYAFKYLWSPIIDQFNLPFFKGMGQRRSWLLLTQLLIIFSLIFISFTDPQKNLYLTAFFVCMLAFFSASQDIVIDAFRIESVPQNKQGALSSMYIAGYRLGMLVSGAGSLWLAAFLGGETYNVSVWNKVYLSMALLMLVGIFANMISKENLRYKKKSIASNLHLRFLSIIAINIFLFIYIYNFMDTFFSSESPLGGFIIAFSKLLTCFVITGSFIVFFIKLNIINKKVIFKSYIDPILNFIYKYGKFAITILFLIAFYRIADVVMGVMANIFYLEKGYQIKDIATYSKFFGVFATILGGFLGGYFAMKYNTMIALFLGALIAAFSNLLFAWLASADTNISFLIMVITADNISSGFAGAAFVVYLSGLTSIKFTATQYALFSSIMLFFPKLIAGYSGAWVDLIGYQNYFIVTALLGLPVLFLIIWIAKVAPVRN